MTRNYNCTVFVHTGTQKVSFYLAFCSYCNIFLPQLATSVFIQIRKLNSLVMRTLSFSACMTMPCHVYAQRDGIPSLCMCSSYHALIQARTLRFFTRIIYVLCVRWTWRYFCHILTIEAAFQFSIMYDLCVQCNHICQDLQKSDCPLIVTPYMCFELFTIHPFLAGLQHTAVIQGGSMLEHPRRL